MHISGGFALLPFLWFVNSIWFFKEAFLKPPYEEQKQIKTCRRCLVVCLVINKLKSHFSTEFISYITAVSYCINPFSWEAKLT